jgi:hypothetical protein
MTDRAASHVPAICRAVFPRKRGGARCHSLVTPFFFIGVALLFLSLVAGCQDNAQQPASSEQPPRAAAAERERPGSAPRVTRPVAKSRPRQPTGGAADEARPRPRTFPLPGEAGQKLDRGLDSDAPVPLPNATGWRELPRPELDLAGLADAGLRRLASQHLQLITDLPSSPAVDELPQVFDQAVPCWCRYFQVEPEDVAAWQMTAYLIRDRSLFRDLGLLTDDLPPFQNGFQLGWQIWIYEQPSEYYQRHMLLHEGTHGFMHLILGGAGPPWYMEGVAELLGTHRWQDGQLQLGYFPQSRDEVEMWGRTRIVQSDVEAGQVKSLDQIMDYGPTAHIDNAPYGWCWAAAAFLDGHPEFQQRFRQLKSSVRLDPVTFRSRFDQLYQEDRNRVTPQWQMFVEHLDYGYDLQREAIVYRDSQPLPAGGSEAEVQADRGWQATGVRVEAGTVYRLSAAGRFQIAMRSQAWRSEPNGVTIEYYAGRPLGLLLAAVSDETGHTVSENMFLDPAPVGLGTDVAFRQSGTLYLRVNDAPSQLADNTGQVTVTIGLPPEGGKSRSAEASR